MSCVRQMRSIFLRADRRGPWEMGMTGASVAAASCLASPPDASSGYAPPARSVAIKNIVNYT